MDRCSVNSVDIDCFCIIQPGMEELKSEGQFFLKPESLLRIEPDFPPVIILHLQQEVRHKSLSFLEGLLSQVLSLVDHVLEAESFFSLCRQEQSRKENEVASSQRQYQNGAEILLHTTK